MDNTNPMNKNIKNSYEIGNRKISQDEPLITIIIPVYNVQDYLKRCVESIIKQTYSNLEIILVDDGSTDKSSEICNEYGTNDVRVKVIHKANGGQSDARNMALDLMRGKFVMMVDSDDWVSPYYVEHLYKALIESDARMAISCFVDVFEEDTAVYALKELSRLEVLSKEECLQRMFYQQEMDMAPWGKLYYAEDFSNVRYPKGKIYEDILVTSEMIFKSDTVVFIGNIDYYYFQRSNSTQNQKFNVRKMDAVKHMKQLLDRVCCEYPNLYVAAECRYFSAVCNILFQINEATYEKYRVFLWQEIKKHRKNILIDKNARTKARFAAAISYLGLGIMRKIYCTTQTRGK